MGRVISHPLVQSFGTRRKLSKEQIGFAGVVVAITLDEAYDGEQRRDAFKFFNFGKLLDRMSRSRGSSVQVNVGSLAQAAEEKSSKGFLGLDKWGHAAKLLGIVLLGAAVWTTALSQSRLERIKDLEGDKTRLQNQVLEHQEVILLMQKTAQEMGAAQKEEDRQALLVKIERTVKSAVTEATKPNKNRAAAASQAAQQVNKPAESPGSD